jgi:hypothetical protein
MRIQEKGMMRKWMRIRNKGKKKQKVSCGDNNPMPVHPPRNQPAQPPPPPQMNNKQEGGKGAEYWLQHIGGGQGVSSKVNS